MLATTYLEAFDKDTLHRVTAAWKAFRERVLAYPGAQLPLKCATE